MESQQLILDFHRYITQHGGDFSDWYTGIAANPEKRLFDDHNVYKGDLWIYAPALDNNEARSIEAYLLTLGCIGGVGGGDNSTKYVYMYKINLHTRQ